MIELRRMTPEDKPAIQAIGSRIWEGSDYLPRVFDDWIRDKDGEFVAAVLDGRLVGCGKLSFFTPTDAWLEGLRKDPEAPVKGMADTITRHMLTRLAHRTDLTSIRFSTYVKNHASIKTSERLGFVRRNVFSCKAWTAQKGPQAANSAELEALPSAARVEVVEQISDEGAVFNFLQRSGYFEATQGLMLEGWRALPFSREIFTSRYLQKGLCRGVRAGGKLHGMSVFVHDTRHAHTFLKLVMIDAEDQTAADSLFDDLFAYVRSHARDENEIEIILPPIPRVRDYCASHGFRSWEQEDDYFVFELPLERLRDL